MATDIPLEQLYEQPVVQQLLSKIEVLESKDLEKEVTLPYIIKDKILMSPGVWNGYYYTQQPIHQAFLKSEWDKKEIRSLFLDHEDARSREWIGEVRNQKMVGDDVVGDLYIVDKATAIKLAYGAKMGISPKVHGRDEENTMQSFVFDNFSVVINPAVKTAYINNQEVNSMTKNQDKKKEEDEMQDTDDSTEVDKKKKYPPAGKEEYPAPKETKMSDVESELSAYTDFIKDYMKKNPGTSIKEAAKAWEKHKMSESIEMADVMEILTALKSDVKELKEQIDSKTMQDEVEKPAEEAEGEKPAEETTTENSENKEEKIQELSEKLKVAETKLNEPDKVTQKTQELSEKGDIDSQLLAHLQGMGPEVL